MISGQTIAVLTGFTACLIVKKCFGQSQPEMWNILAGKTLLTNPQDAGCEARTPAATFCVPDIYGLRVPLGDHCLVRECTTQNADVASMTDQRLTSVFVTKNLTASLELTAELPGTFSIFYFWLAFSGNPPMAIVMQRRSESDSAWTMWRYFAVDCASTFGVSRYQGPADAGSSGAAAVQCSALNWTSSHVSNINFLTWDILMDRPVTSVDDPTSMDQLTRASFVRIILIGYLFSFSTTTFSTYGGRVYGIAEISAYGRCATGYYRPLGNDTSCLSCRCSITGALNQTCTSLGVCPCKPGYSGSQCEQCQLAHFNTSSGCPVCDCDALGSTGTVCDGQTGTCQCRIGFSGARCDICQTGWYLAGRECVPCDCSVGGVTEEICDRKGTCRCKRFVSGSKCNVCLDGFVDFSSSNPNGCSGQPISPVLAFDSDQNHPISNRDLNFSLSDNASSFHFIETRNNTLSYIGGFSTDPSVSGATSSALYPWLIAITVLLILALLTALIHFILYIRRRSWQKAYSPGQVPEFLTADNSAVKNPDDGRSRKHGERPNAKLTGYFYNPEYPLGSLTPGAHGRRETNTNRNHDEFEADQFASDDVAETANGYSESRRQLDLRQEPASTGVLPYRPHGQQTNNQRMPSRHGISTISGGITNENFDIRPEEI